MNKGRKKNGAAILRRELAEARSLVGKYELEARRLERRISRSNGKTPREKAERLSRLHDTLLPAARLALAEAKEQVAQINARR